MHLSCKVNDPSASSVLMKTSRNFLSSSSCWNISSCFITSSFFILMPSTTRGHSTGWSMAALGNRKRMANVRKSRYGRFWSEIWTRSARSVWSSVNAARREIEDEWNGKGWLKRIGGGGGGGGTRSSKFKLAFSLLYPHILENRKSPILPPPSHFAPP